MRAPRRIVVGTRGSRLARIQTGYVAGLLRSALGETLIEERTIETGGDIDRDTPLAAMGGRGAFTSALERALGDGTIDVAVHSLKDLPVSPAAGLRVAAILGREDAGDALISAGNLALNELPHGATVGTSSVRRAAQLRAARSDLRIADIRGNVETRIAKVRDGSYAAIVLAVAGLRRLGLLGDVAEYLDPEVMLPAPGQGALAVQCRDESHLVQLLSRIDEEPSRAACTAERAFLAGLDGGCSAPVGALARAGSAGAGSLLYLRLTGGVFAPDGSQVIRVSGEGNDPEELGRRLAGQALDRGAGAIVARVHGSEHGGANGGRSDSGNGHERRSQHRTGAEALSGRRVLLTAASDRAMKSVERLRALGIEPRCISLISSQACGEVPLSEAFARRSEFAWVVLTSRTAAQRLIDAVHAAGEGVRWGGLKIAAVGPSTAEEIEAAGIPVSFMPAEYRGAVLAEKLPIEAGDTVLLPQAADANRETERILTERGAAVTRIATYRTVRAHLSDRERAEIVHGFDAVLLTSGSQAASLAAVLAEAGYSPAGPPGFSGIAERSEVLCIGPTTAHAAADLGFRVAAWAREHTIDALVDLLVRRWTG